MQPHKDWRAWLDTTAAIAIILASASVVWAAISIRASIVAAPNRQDVPQAARPVPRDFSLEGTATLGPPSATVGVIEFSDFECPFCGTFARETLPNVLDKYVGTGRAFLGFRHLPLEALHPNARRAAIAADCANQQGKFREVHDLFFSAPGKLSERHFRDAALLPGLDSRTFNTCLNQENANVARDITLARSLGIRATPTFAFGIRRHDGTFRVIRTESGAVPFARFAELLDATIGDLAAERAAAR